MPAPILKNPIISVSSNRMITIACPLLKISYIKSNVKEYRQIHGPSYTNLFYLSGKKSTGSDSFSKSMSPTKFTETPSSPTTFARSQVCKFLPFRFQNPCGQSNIQKHPQVQRHLHAVKLVNMSNYKTNLSQSLI